mmetsp:Transcript_86501/g.253184  ORF Transcript_86501/g.253184 Transcript_86501/m.253184 type:complete len:352 (+) Transcript_86501:58-1113(+)
MGSASSLKQKYGAPKSTNVTPLTRSNTATLTRTGSSMNLTRSGSISVPLDQVGDLRQSSPARTSSRKTSTNIVSLESEAMQKWHKSHCSDTDFGSAVRIRDAFEFDASNKEVSKRERVWSIGDGARRDYGTVKVARGYPSKIECDVCGIFIVDRNGENLFFFCWRCRRAGRSLRMCAGCYEDGALGDGPRQLPDQHGPGVAATQSGGGRAGSKQRSASVRSSQGALRSPGPKASRGSTGSSSPSAQTLSPGIPSGTWKGWIMEGRNRRVIKRTLSFLMGGSIIGSGDEGCTVEGSWRGGVFYHHVKWVEMYEWGQLEVAVQLTVTTPTAAHLEGEFSASDGGKGMLDLTFP